MVLLLQRYLLRELLRAFLLALVAVTSVMVILVMGQATMHSPVPPIHVLRALPFFLPQVLSYTIPATALFAATLVYGRFAHENEYDAVRMSGVHPMVIVVPAAVLAMALTGAVLYCTAELAPLSHYRVRNLSQNVQALSDTFFSTLRDEGNVKAGPFTIWAKSVEGQTAKGVRIQQSQPKTYKLEMSLAAKEATFRFDPETREVEVTAKDALVETYEGAQTTGRVETIHELRYALPTPPNPKPADEPFGVLLRTLGTIPDPGVARAERAAVERWRADYERERRTLPLGTADGWLRLGRWCADHQMYDEAVRAFRESAARDATFARPAGLAEAQVEIDRHRLYTARALLTRLRADFPADDEVRKRLTHARERIGEILREVHMRLSTAVSCLTFVLVGVPLAVGFRRAHILAAFLVALGPMLLFHVVTLMIRNLATAGSLPAWTIWSGNVLLAALGVALLRRMFRR